MESDIMKAALAVIEDAARGETDRCVTFQGRGDDCLWAQITWEHLNFAYPHNGPFAESFPGLDAPWVSEITAFEPGLFITFETATKDVSAISKFVLEYFRSVLDVEPHEIAVSLDEVL